MTTTKQDNSVSISVAVPLAVLAKYGPEAGLFLAQSAYLTRLYGREFHLPVKGKADPSAGTLIGRIGSWDALGLSPRRQRRIRAQLAADGLLVTWLGDVPQRRWYRVDLAAYDELVADAASRDKSSPPAVSEQHPQQPQAGSTGDDGPTGPAVPDRDGKRDHPGTANKQTHETDVDVLDTGARADTRAGDGPVTHDHGGDDPRPPPPVAAVIDHLAMRGHQSIALRETLVRRWHDGELHVTPDDVPERLIRLAASHGEARDAVIARILRLCRHPSSDPAVASSEVTARYRLQVLGFLSPEPSDSDDD